MNTEDNNKNSMYSMEEGQKSNISNDCQQSIQDLIDSKLASVLEKQQHKHGDYSLNEGSPRKFDKDNDINTLIQLLLEDRKQLKADNLKLQLKLEMLETNDTSIRDNTLKNASSPTSKLHNELKECAILRLEDVNKALQIRLQEKEEECLKSAKKIKELESDLELLLQQQQSTLALIHNKLKKDDTSIISNTNSAINTVANSITNSMNNGVPNSIKSPTNNAAPVKKREIPKISQKKLQIKMSDDSITESPSTSRIPTKTESKISEAVTPTRMSYATAPSSARKHDNKSPMSKIMKNYATPLKTPQAQSGTSTPIRGGQKKLQTPKYPSYQSPYTKKPNEENPSQKSTPSNSALNPQKEQSQALHALKSLISPSNAKTGNSPSTTNNLKDLKENKKLTDHNSELKKPAAYNNLIGGAKKDNGNKETPISGAYSNKNTNIFGLRKHSLPPTQANLEKIEQEEEEKIHKKSNSNESLNKKNGLEIEFYPLHEGAVIGSSNHDADNNFHNKKQDRSLSLTFEEVGETEPPLNESEFAFLIDQSDYQNVKKGHANLKDLCVPSKMSNAVARIKSAELNARYANKLISSPRGSTAAGYLSKNVSKTPDRQRGSMIPTVKKASKK